MKFETRMEAKVLIPILGIMIAQIVAAIAWGSSLQERVGKLEAVLQAQTAQLERIESSQAEVGRNILQLTRELSR
jgi:ABC-type enterochelin transport system permease subunit